MAGKDDRLFNDKGFKHYRPTYSVREVQIGLAVVAGLAAVAGWVAWRGAHPDPELFAAAPPQAHRGRKTVDRSPLPQDLAPAGWRETGVRRFGPDDVYEKINGREGYYKSYDFKELVFASYAAEDDPTQAVDVEMFRHGSADAALGAMSGELPEGADVQADPEQGLRYDGPNVSYVVRGPWYGRVIGPSTDVVAAVRSIADGLQTLPGAPLSPGHRLFMTAFGVGPADVAYYAEEAFSFEFARRVYAATLQDEAEVFVMPAADPQASAQAFREGFLQYGEPEGPNWVRDRYLDVFHGARGGEGVVYGVRGAPSVEAADALLVRLRKAVPDFSPPEPDPPEGEEQETGTEAPGKAPVDEYGAQQQ